MAKPATPAELGVVVGDVFLDKYRVDAILGHGGMGVVCACTHLELDERCAIKMLRQDVLLDHDARERFQREAQAAVKLKSEHAAHVYDVGRLDNGTPYIVMEFLDGLDLGQLLEERGVLQPPFASELMLQTCEALAEAHSLGIVHRDVKPTNLFLTWRTDGTAIIKVLDFGISKSAAATDMHLTQTQSVLGTPAYMSPEQMRSARTVDSRSDIWSLGSVFYELLEGRRPFEADSFSEMCVKVAVDEPTPMANTPLELQPVILRCLAKAPEQRYPNMAELGRDLVPFTPAPPQAAVLVERMQRMLRRSHGTWDGDSASGPSLVPINDPRSGPVRLPSPAVWQGGSNPASMRHASPRPDSLAIAPGGSAIDAPLTTARTRRRVWPWLFVAAPVIGIGVALALAMGGTGEAPSEATPAARQAVETPAKAEPAKTEPHRQVEPKKVEPAPAAVEPEPHEAPSQPAETKHVAQPDHVQHPARPRDTKPHDAKPHDAKPHDATPQATYTTKLPKSDPRCDISNYMNESHIPCECETAVAGNCGKK